MNDRILLGFLGSYVQTRNLAPLDDARSGFVWYVCGACKTEARTWTRDVWNAPVERCFDQSVCSGTMRPDHSLGVEVDPQWKDGSSRVVEIRRGQ